MCDVEILLKFEYIAVNEELFYTLYIRLTGYNINAHENLITYLMVKVETVWKYLMIKIQNMFIQKIQKYN